MCPERTCGQRSGDQFKFEKKFEEKKFVKNELEDKTSNTVLNLFYWYGEDVNLDKLIESKLKKDYFKEHYLHKYNFNKIICAGGETSGAIVKALMIKELQNGEEISAGVPVIWEPEKNIKIPLKSGNFGQKDFFSRALKKL